MRKISTLIFACIVCLVGFSQTSNLDSILTVRKFQKDSSLKAAIHADSMKIEKEYKEKERWDRIEARAQYPVLKAGEFSGIIPVNDITESPDPTLDYKLLFELTDLNPDSTAKEVNYGISEVARVINLHVAAGVPVKKITPVLVVHAGALKAFGTNEYYRSKFKTDNPNLKALEELKKLGAKFIMCGQAMTFLNIQKEDLVPEAKVSLTAQTVISSYQLKGYLLWWGGAGKH